ncbi:MAG: hypothetical protein ACW99E_07515 [Promethearchaeota archaeon]|jgi:DNA-binding HxlR family transcriptional regulator
MYKKEGLAITCQSSNLKNRTSLAMPDLDIKANHIKGNRENVLRGKTLKVFWHILTHNRVGVKEIQKTLKIVSSRAVSYQINTLVKAGIILKNEEDGKYYINKDIKLKPKEKITVATVIYDKSDFIDKKRALKRWKQSFGYFCLHPEKFRFGLRDL